MPLTGQVERRSRCCKARLEWNHTGAFQVCSECKRGSWPDGVSYDHVYLPSDYEMALEKRIEALERRFESNTR